MTQSGGEKLTLEYLDMGCTNWLKSTVLAAKYPSGVFLRKNDSLTFNVPIPDKVKKLS